MKVATAFARRAPFRDGRLRLPGSGEASGVWMISGVPFFDPRGGRFCGFRGTARRVQEDVAVAAEEVASPTPAAPTILAERSEEHTSELQSLMRISYAVFCLKKKKIKYQHKL